MKAAKAGTDRVARRRYVEELKTKPEVACYWCDEPTTPASRHIDHIIPVSRRGRDDVFNLCCSCPTCNCSKHDSLPEEFTGQYHFDFAPLAEGETPRRNAPRRLRLAELDGVELSQRQRAVFEMRFTKRMGCKKIAKELGISANNVSRKLARIRQRVGHKYAPTVELPPVESVAEAQLRCLFKDCPDVNYLTIRNMARQGRARGISTFC